MSITIEAVYEAGVLKPLSPLPNLKEHERVHITLEIPSIVDEMQGKISIDPAVAQEIIENADYSILQCLTRLAEAPSRLACLEQGVIGKGRQGKLSTIR